MLALGSLQDLWQHRTVSWSAPALSMLNLALAPSTWWQYCSSLLQFQDHCWREGSNFPPEEPIAVATIANFIKTATRATQWLSLTINRLLVVIATLYEPLGLHPTHDPLIKPLRWALVCDCTKQPINHGCVFDVLCLTNLFLG
jgi:hypothetical protein